MIKAQELISKFEQSLAENWGYIYYMKHVTWSEARQKNYDVAYANDQNAQQSIKYGSKWYGHIVTDCSGLFAWWIQQLGGAIAHGSNSIYRNYCSAKGQLKNGKKYGGGDLKPGTAVFTGTADSHGHIGLYVGNGYVIEAKGAKYGVIKKKITEGSWTYWGELKMIEYEQGGQPEPEPEPAEEEYPTIRRGSKGKYVTLAQVKLISAGYSVGPDGADGDFGKNTEKAVKLFQQDWGLKADGIIGPQTWQKLLASPQRATYTVTIRNLTAEQKDKLKEQYPDATVTPEE